MPSRQAGSHWGYQTKIKSRSAAAVLGIALALNLTVGAVKRHLNSITSKLGLPSVAEPERPEVNVRALAVLAFLHSSGSESGADM
jgi:hypothetical protein